MLRDGAEDGITGVVSTSHVLDQLDSKTEKRYMKRFNVLKEKVHEAGIPIELWLGCELHINTIFDVKSPIATLNGNGRYILIEFPMNSIPKEYNDKLVRIVLNSTIPILAHPERNQILMNNPNIIYNFVRRGLLIQVNAGSLTGLFGRKVKKFAWSLVERNLVHFVASDSHDTENRPMRLSHAHMLIEKSHGEVLAKQLFHDNPMHAITGKIIIPREPRPFEIHTSWVKTFFRSKSKMKE
jgi:protein-tyrosine phosphatase